MQISKNMYSDIIATISRGIVVFTDASFDPYKGKSACGLVIADEQGNLKEYKTVS